MRSGDELVWLSPAQLVMGRRGRFHKWERHLGKVLIKLFERA